MYIVRNSGFYDERLFARADYEGLTKEAAEQLKALRSKAAKKMLDGRKAKKLAEARNLLGATSQEGIEYGQKEINKQFQKTLKNARAYAKRGATNIRKNAANLVKEGAVKKGWYKRLPTAAKVAIPVAAGLGIAGGGYAAYRKRNRGEA